MYLYVKFNIYKFIFEFLDILIFFVFMFDVWIIRKVFFLNVFFSLGGKKMFFMVLLVLLYIIVDMLLFCVCGLVIM